jgi:hypothetical protein
MGNSDPRSWLDKLVGVCLSVLVGAAAIYIAVRLVQAVWTALLVIIGVGLFVVLSVALLRARGRGW